MPPSHVILIADDEKNTREGLSLALERPDCVILTAAHGGEALEILRTRPVDLLLTDIRMPEMDGNRLIDAAREVSPSTEIIVLTGHGTVENAVEAMKKGVFDYLLKPISLDELGLLVERVLEKRALREENQALHEQLEERHGFEHIIGSSTQMDAVFQRVRQVAPTRATVLIHGESGTGKELIAGAIHYHSPRKEKRFVKINCGALAPTLLESELFGHEAGAFTDARKQKIGRFELADGGTLFLDEVTETSPDFQVKLLRVLQEQEFERVGGSDTIHVDVRVIAASNQDIEKCVREGRFREDLYYRLNVVRMEIPPLRERQGDIPLLVQAFLKECCEANGKPLLKISQKTLDALARYPWPGNVRQLRNAIEGMVVLSTAHGLTPRNLPPEILSASKQPTLQIKIGATLEDMEREMIRATLAQNGGNRAATARSLGVGRKTLYRKLEEYGLESSAEAE
ncbi:TPA: transcriptional regulator [Candidatus Sumerlaeota bacterium]|jgi:DNA-binding NtrC family response regulator|nr:transcriptional regulator [Candidatus Sumerlaeota bacterium]